MNLDLIRFTPDNSEYSITATFGKFFFEGKPVCYSMEKNETLIEPGSYPFSLYWSRNNKCIVPLLGGVANRSELEIHPANWLYEINGCIAPGLSINKSIPNINMSKIAFGEICKIILKNNFSGTLNIK